MNKRVPLYERINNHVPVGTWLSLTEICEMIGSSSRSLVKVTLFAMPNVEKIQAKDSIAEYHGFGTNSWLWMFRRIE